MKKFFFAILLIAIISGCSSSGAKNPFAYNSIHTGVEGVTLEFISNAPPSELPAPKQGEGYPFRAGIKISNKGAHDTEGHLTLSYEKDYMDIQDSEKPFKLEGRSVTNPTGQSDILLYSGNTKAFKDSQTEKHQSILLATACYKYRTELKTDVCIDTDVLEVTQRQKTCTAKDSSFSSQGAPVGVSKLEVRMFPEGNSGKITGVKPQFNVYIRNVGTGQIMSPLVDPKTMCSASFINSESEEFKKVWNSITVSGILSGSELVCTPSPLKLTEKEGSVRCSLKSGESFSSDVSSYLAPMVIYVDYGYTSTISKDISINRETTY